MFQLHDELKNGTYRHSDYTSFYVFDPKLRHIHKACVRDRVLHQAVFRVLYPIFDKSFIFDSYSCRFGKGTHRAVARLEIFSRKLSRNHTRNIFALKCDIKRFFDSVDQDVLIDLIGRRITNPGALWLIRTIIASLEKLPGQGLPLGNVTSQLFANIYLNELDQFIKHELKQKHYLRYCDDFVILGERPADLVEIAKRINDFLAQHLKLSLHPDKVIIRKYCQGIDFLGYVVLPQYRVLRTKTKVRLLKRVNEKNLPSYLGVLKHCSWFKIGKKLPPYFTPN
ncbi:MAG: group II intron reverse transcriptase domain-containing protein [Parcubacteria group bacterium]|nr:group II intron reverse transcriptase domain-containing protein [Parcubacteria group bacterium]